MDMLISGKPMPSGDGKTIEVINPATNEFLDTIPDATKEDVDLAVERSKAGQREWAAKPLAARAKILRRFIELVEENRIELAALLTKEMGKPYGDSLRDFGAIEGSFNGFIEVAKHIYNKVPPASGMPGSEKDMQVIIREPLGTIAAIIPFNAPVQSFASKVAPSLVAGNAVVVKPASDNPLVIIRLTELLIEAGVTADAVHVVTGRGSGCGTYLVSSPGINGVLFTGSTEVGLEIARMADQNLNPSCLELGGNDPCIVLEDADLELAVKEVLIGRSINAGQICVSPKRLIIHESLVEAFTKRLLEEVPKLKVGDPFDPDIIIGSMISEKAAIEVERQVSHTVAQGATLLWGGERNGAFYTPAILGGVTPDMDIAKDMEVFGAVFTIISVKDEEEAITVANQTKYGLSGGVFTKDIQRGMSVASRIEAGGCVVNGSGFYISPYQPFGGVKMSGKGRDGFASSLDGVTREKTITIRNIR